MADLQFITYKGKEILYANHQGLAGDQLIENLKKVNSAIIEKGSGVLLLADFNGAFISNEGMAYLKSEETVKASKAIVKTATVGITGIKKILANTYNKLTGKEAHICGSIEEAKEYLVS